MLAEKNKQNQSVKQQRDIIENDEIESGKVVHAHEEQMWKVRVDVVKLNKRINSTVI